MASNIERAYNIGSAALLEGDQSLLFIFVDDNGAARGRLIYASLLRARLNGASVGSKTKHANAESNFVFSISASHSNPLLLATLARVSTKLTTAPVRDIRLGRTVL